MPRSGGGSYRSGTANRSHLSVRTGVCQPAVSHQVIWIYFTFNVLTDLYLISIPVLMLWKAALRPLNKVGLILLFRGGLFIMICPRSGAFFLSRYAAKPSPCHRWGLIKIVEARGWRAASGGIMGSPGIVRRRRHDQLASGGPAAEAMAYIGSWIHAVDTLVQKVGQVSYQSANHRWRADTELTRLRPSHSEPDSEHNVQ